MTRFQEALVELLRKLAEEHIMNGLDCDEAVTLGIVELQRQMRGTRLNLEARLIDDAVFGLRYVREPGTRH